MNLGELTPDLKVLIDAEIESAAPPGTLPSPTDEGDVLTVVSGDWAGAPPGGSLPGVPVFTAYTVMWNTTNLLTTGAVICALAGGDYLIHIGGYVPVDWTTDANSFFAFGTTNGDRLDGSPYARPRQDGGANTYDGIDLAELGSVAPPITGETLPSLSDWGAGGVLPTYGVPVLVKQNCNLLVSLQKFGGGSPTPSAGTLDLIVGILTPA